MNEKIKVWYKSQDKVKIMLIMIVLAFLVVELTPSFKSQVDTAIQETRVIEKLEKKVLEVDRQQEVIEKKSDKKEAEQCTINEAGKLVLADASILKQSNYVFYDLDTFKYGTNRYDYTTSKKNKKNIFGVRYAREDRDGTQIYLMIYENVDNLKVNKKEYEKFMESQK